MSTCSRALCAHLRVHKEVREQLSGVYSLLLLHVSQGLNLGYQAWRQAPLTQASCQAKENVSSPTLTLAHFQATQCCE